jgi:hypothetical protein
LIGSVTLGWSRSSVLKTVALSAPPDPAGWSSVDKPPSADVLKALSGAGVLSRRYRSSDGMIVDLAVLSGDGRDMLHDPRSCLVGAGAQIEDDKSIALPGGGFIVRNCIVQMPGVDAPYDTIYFYATQRGEVVSPTDIRRDLLWDTIIGAKNPVVFVRFMGRIEPRLDGSARMSAHEKMLEFASDTIKLLKPELDRMIGRQ